MHTETKHQQVIPSLGTRAGVGWEELFHETLVHGNKASMELHASVNTGIHEPRLQGSCELQASVKGIHVQRQTINILALQIKYYLFWSCMDIASLIPLIYTCKESMSWSRGKENHHSCPPSVNVKPLNFHHQSWLLRRCVAPGPAKFS